MHRLHRFKLTFAIFMATILLPVLARAGYTPIALTPGSYNADIIVEAGSPPPLSAFTTATLDAGTNNTGNTFFQIGYNTNLVGTPPPITLGMPAPGSTINYSALGINYAFLLPPSYATNNVVLVGHNAGGGSAIITNGSLNLTTPASYYSISILYSAGNGTVQMRFTVKFADGTDETGTFGALDWFGNAGLAVYTNLARFSVSGGTFDVRAAGSASVQLYKYDYNIANASGTITNIEFSYNGGTTFATANGRTAIFGVSGSTDGGLNYSGIPVSGFNHDIVVENTAPQPAPLPASTPSTATMDGGTATNALGQLSGNTFMERGYYARFPNAGVPVAGSTFTSASLSAQYTMAPSYTANDVVMLDRTNQTANVTPASLAAYGALSFLVSGANGATTLITVIQYADGSSQTNALTTLDAFNNGVLYAYTCFGRVNFGNRTINNTPDQVTTPYDFDPRTFVLGNAINPNPKLYDAILVTSNSVSSVTNIFIIRTNGLGSTARSAIFALSGVPVGQVPPQITAQPAGGNGIAPASLKNWAGSNFTFSVSAIEGSGPTTYQWQRAAKGGGVRNIFNPATFANVVNGGNISGALTNSLTISNSTPANSGDYWCIVSNPYGTQTSGVVTVTVLSTNADVTSLTDPISAYQPNGGSFPVNQTPANTIDGDPSTKYLNFGVNSQPFNGPVGLIVTPSQGASIVTGVRLYTGNDTGNVGRDPVDYLLEGSNDGGGTWATISGGNLIGTLILPIGRNTAVSALNPVTQNVQEVNFANSTGYTSYRLSFPHVIRPAIVNSMEIGEVELLGTLVPNPPTFTRIAPPTVTVYVGGSATLSVAATGLPTPKYQWLSNGVPVLNATNSVYTFPNAQLVDSGRTFSCVASNSFLATNSPTTTLQVLPAPTQVYPVAVLSDNPLAYIRLNEADDFGGNNGAVANDYWGGHSGIYTSTVLGQPGYNPAADPDTAGRFGVLDTQNSYIGNINDISFSAVTNTSRNFSVEAWVNGAAQTLDAGIVTKGFGGGNEQFNLDTGGGNHGFRFFIRDTGNSVHIAASSVALDGKWHHVVGVCNETNSEIVLYIDGLRAATGAVSPSNGVFNSTIPISIGARQQVAGPYNLQFNGVIDEVAIYGYSLSSNQVFNHYLASTPAPLFTLTPTNSAVNESNAVTFFSSAYGPQPQGYQWYQSLDGGSTFNLIGINNSNLDLTAVPFSWSSSQYYVVATNVFASSTSAIVTLTVNGGAPVVLTDLPANSMVYAGRTVTLKANIGGTEPITYSWTSNGIPISNGGRFSGANTNALKITNAQVSDSAVYQVSAVNAAGGPTASTPSALFVQAVPTLNTNGTGWALNGTPAVATIASDVLTLTTGAGNTIRSAFYPFPMYVGAFTASFTYQATPALTAADGAAFVLQNDTRGTAALGGGGGAIGYSGITPSAALEFNIYNPNVQGIAFRTNGATGTPYAPTTPVNVASGNPIDVTINYGSGVMSVTVKDTVTASTFTTNITVGSLSAIVGGETAYVGFTAADGGTASTQTISKFKFIPYPVLTSQITGPGAVTLSWLSSIGGYNLQTTNSLGGPAAWAPVNTFVNQVGNQNQVTVSPAIGNQFYRLFLLVP